jgi:hypothetical protein
VLVPAVVGGARASGGDPSAEREKVRSQRAEVAAQVDALRAQDADVEAALADLEANVAGQEALLAEARRAAAAARDAVAAALEAEADAEARIDVLEDEVRERAVDAFIHPPGDDVFDTVESESLNDAAQRNALLSLQSDRDADILDQLDAAREDRAIARRNAQTALRRAEEKEAEADSRLEKVRAAREQHARFASQVQARLDAALAESAHLASVDAQLAQEIAAQQAALAARIKRTAGGGGGGGGGGVRRVGNVQLATATAPSGCSITVNAEIVTNVQRLLDAAAADGVPMCGGGYRSSEAQIALRRAHCGESDYDIYEKPSYECSPPTAPPGSSMHEQGLAVDFTYGGSVIGSRSSPAFAWLDANASSYGLYNLPSEPWHWSTNGN